MATRYRSISPVRIRLNQRALRRKTEAEIERNMHVCGVWLRDRIKVKLNRAQRTRILRSGHIIGLSPSLPGTPPKKITGQLQNSIRYRVGRSNGALVLVVGSNLKKALWLEVGTRKMKSRPYLRKTILENRAKIGRIIVHGRRAI